MNDELDALVKLGAGGGVLLMIQTVWKSFMASREKAVDKVDADRDAKLLYLEKRIDGGLAAHSTQIQALREFAVRTDERLQVREGRRGEPKTLVTHLSPAQQAQLAQAYEKVEEDHD